MISRKKAIVLAAGIVVMEAEAALGARRLAATVSSLWPLGRRVVSGRGWTRERTSRTSEVVGEPPERAAKRRRILSSVVSLY